MSYSVDKNWEERRRFRRVGLKEAVRYEFKDPRQFGGCVSGDIGAGGIKLTLNDFVPLKTDLALRVHLAGDLFVDCPGRVVWVEKVPFGDGYRVGLRFVEGETSPDAREVIHNFVVTRTLEKAQL